MLERVNFYVGDRVSPETRREREAFSRVRNAHRQYTMRLRQVARHIGDLCRSFDVNDTGQLHTLVVVLEHYAKMLQPWARNTARQMLADVSRRDANAWARYARYMGYEIQRQMATAPIGIMFDQLVDENADLITSLADGARQRIMRIAQGQLYSGQRAGALADEIYNTGHVTRSRAELIAYTETSRAATAFTEVRAKHVGSTGYIWRTAQDTHVRPRHRALSGSFHRWDEPPVSGENGERSHPGAIYRCRCYPEVVFPDF